MLSFVCRILCRGIIVDPAIAGKMTRGIQRYVQYVSFSYRRLGEWECCNNILRGETLSLHDGIDHVRGALPIKAALSTTPRGTQVVCEMAKSILGPVFEENLYRLHLWGGGSQASNGGGGVDDYIGRAAHVSTPFFSCRYGVPAICGSKEAPIHSVVAHGLLGYIYFILLFFQVA